MSRVSAHTRAEFLNDLYAHTELTIVEADSIGRRLLRYGSTYKRLQEAFCSVDMGEDEAYYRRQEERIEKRVRAICELFGARPVFGGDPRGATIKLVLPDGYTNDWGHTGLCIVTS